LRGDVCTDENKTPVKERLSNVETPVMAGFEIRNGVSADAERAAAIFHTDVTRLDVVARYKKIKRLATGLGRVSDRQIWAECGVRPTAGKVLLRDEGKILRE
jgi:hypothetical protein